MAQPLDPVRSWELASSGAGTIVDLGMPGDFALGHPKGALSLVYSEKGLDDRLSNVLPQGTPIILLAASPEQGEAASAQLTEGSFPLLGIIEGGRSAWQAAGLPEDSFDEVSVGELGALTPSNDLVVLDVREPMEWETGHVPGAMLIPLGNLRQHIQSIPREARVTVICEAGVRSSAAASILQAQGFTNVANVPEGTAGYRRAGLPLQYPESSPPQGGNDR